MVKVREGSEWIEAQTSATMERDVGSWKQRVVNCKDALKQKVAALTEDEKEQSKLRRKRDTDLAKVRAELDAEWRARTDAEQLRGQLSEAQVDVVGIIDEEA
jgi:hypothetical protein